MEGHFDSEMVPLLPVDLVPAAARRGRVPVRLLRVPVQPMRSNQDGWLALSAGARERFTAIESEAGGYLAFEVAWFAANGDRGIAEIAELVRDEGHGMEEDVLEEWFGLVVEMGVAVEQNLDVIELESELDDVRLDLRRGLDEAAVDQDVTRRRGDQVGGDVGCADVVEILGDAERRDRLVPRAPLFGGLARRRRRLKREKRTQ